MSDRTPTVASRRSFLRTSAAVTGTSLAGLALARSAHAAGGDTLKVGLIGCGGRGTGAAKQALAADENVKLTALAPDVSHLDLVPTVNEESCRDVLTKPSDIGARRTFRHATTVPGKQHDA